MNPATGMMNPATGMMNPSTGMMTPGTSMQLDHQHLASGMHAGMVGAGFPAVPREEHPDQLSSSNPKRRRRQQVASGRGSKKAGPVVIYAATWDSVVAGVSDV